MNLTELIMSANARGHIGVRGELHDDHRTLIKALDLDLIRLVSAWTSTEDDLPEYRGGPIDRRVYALTHKGWDLKINARDTLPSYKASILEPALAAHYGELEEGPDLRYLEEAFDDWQDPVLHGSYTGRLHKYTYEEVTRGLPEIVTTPAHQHPRGPMPNTVIDPPLVYTAKAEDVMRQSAKAPTDITPPPGYALIHDEIYPVDTPYPGRELKVPDDHWLPPMPYPSPWFPSPTDWVYIVAAGLAIGTAAVWIAVWAGWLS